MKWGTSLPEQGLAQLSPADGSLGVQTYSRKFARVEALSVIKQVHIDFMVVLTIVYAMMRRRVFQGIGAGRFLAMNTAWLRAIE